MFKKRETTITPHISQAQEDELMFKFKLDELKRQEGFEIERLTNEIKQDFEAKRNEIREVYQKLKGIIPS